MRVALVGVAHWHTPFYLESLLALDGVQVVGVADPVRAAAERAAREAGCPAETDEHRLYERVAPDFVFALGRHCDMAAMAQRLIERRIPFAMEKPCGLNAAGVADIAALAHAAGVFAAVPFVFRYGEMLRAIREVAAGEAVRYASFKLVAGDVSRYRENGCDWMLRRATAGGGCTLNLGVHFLDLARLLLGPVSVASAAMSNALAGLDVEDHGVVTLRGASGTCLVETGYLYPAPTSTFDMHFSVRTEHHHFAARDADSLEVVDEARNLTLLRMPTTNVPYYPAFTRDVLRRVAAGEPPPASLDDMLEVMRLVEAAYAVS